MGDGAFCDVTVDHPEPHTHSVGVFKVTTVDRGAAGIAKKPLFPGFVFEGGEGLLAADQLEAVEINEAIGGKGGTAGFAAAGTMAVNNAIDRAFELELHFATQTATLVHRAYLDERISTLTDKQRYDSHISRRENYAF